MDRPGWLELERNGLGLGFSVTDRWCIRFAEALFYFSDIFIARRCGDTWRFGIHLIFLNLLKYSFSKILYHNGEFLI
jgi:hypothetical protein